MNMLRFISFKIGIVDIATVIEIANRSSNPFLHIKENGKLTSEWHNDEDVCGCIPE